MHFLPYYTPRVFFFFFFYESRALVVDSLQPADGVVWQKVMKLLGINHTGTLKNIIFINSFDFIVENNINGDYHEFGCHKASDDFHVKLFWKLSVIFWTTCLSTLMTASKAFLNSPQSTEHNNNTRWTPGSLATSQEDFLSLITNSNLFNPNIHLIPGFYSETLTHSFFDNSSLSRKASLINIDCDLYESAVSVSISLTLLFKKVLFYISMTIMLVIVVILLKV